MLTSVVRVADKHRTEKSTQLEAPSADSEVKPPSLNLAFFNAI
jgi:hypothetical protein